MRLLPLIACSTGCLISAPEGAPQTWPPKLGVSVEAVTSGDLNGDGVSDFAVILSRRGARKDNGQGVAETHRYVYPLAVVIFNGTKKGTYNKALVEDIEAPYVCFLNTHTVKGKKKLYFAVFETDADTRIFSPAGKAYKIEYR